MRIMWLTLWFLLAIPMSLLYLLWFMFIWSWVLVVRTLADDFAHYKYKMGVRYRQHGTNIGYDRPVFSGPSSTDPNHKKHHRRGHRGGRKHKHGHHPHNR